MDMKSRYRTRCPRRTILRPSHRYGKRDFLAWRLANLVLNVVASKAYCESIRALISDGLAYRSQPLSDEERQKLAQRLQSNLDEGWDIARQMGQR